MNLIIPLLMIIAVVQILRLNSDIKKDLSEAEEFIELLRSKNLHNIDNSKS